MATFALPSFPTQLTTEMIGTLRICPEIAFADHKGKRKSGIEKKSRKLLSVLQPALEKFLETDETILSVFRAQSHVTGLQQYTMGIMVYGLTAAVVVVTDKRLVQLRTKSLNTWDLGIRVFKWECVARATVKGIFGKELNAYFLDGKKHRVWKLPGAQAKVLKKLVPELIQAKNHGAATPGGVAQLCPECKGALVPGNYECPSCKLLFKNEKKMRWLALLPGAAYFYCGKPLLGLLDFLGEGLLVLAVLLNLFDLVSGESAPTEDLMVGLGILAFLIVIEVAITIHHCQHFVQDFIPTKEHAMSPEQAYAANVGFKT